MSNRKISFKRNAARSYGWSAFLLGVQYRNLTGIKTVEIYLIFWILRITTHK